MWLGINENYECSEEGTIRNKKTLRLLKSYDVHGYKYTRIGSSSTSIKTGVHRVVASLFLPHPTEPNLEVDHIDRNRSNNHASNLRWVNRHINSLNKSKEKKPRKGNKLNEIHITKDEYDIYIVSFNCSKIKHRSRHRDLNEAIKIRDTILDAI